MYIAIIDDQTYLSILQQTHSQELFDLIDGSRDSLKVGLSFLIKQLQLMIQRPLFIDL